MGAKRGDPGYANNAAAVLEALAAAEARALEAVGVRAEGYAKALAPVRTGQLRDSIGHRTLRGSVEVGSTLERAVYTELGTGGGGRDSADPHAQRRSAYRPAHPFLAPAVMDHLDEYREIVEGEMRGGEGAQRFEDVAGRAGR